MAREFTTQVLLPGNPSLTLHAATKGYVDTQIAGAVGFVNHGSNASMARPTTGFAVYIWRGTVQPTNMGANDMFWDVS